MALQQESSFKNKLAGLCYFEGQIIGLSEKAETLATAIGAVEQDLTETLTNLRATASVANIDICTATNGSSNEQADTQKLEESFRSLIKSSSKFVSQD